MRPMISSDNGSMSGSNSISPSVNIAFFTQSLSCSMSSLCEKKLTLIINEINLTCELCSYIFIDLIRIYFLFERLNYLRTWLI
jgi:hypothetical protein